MPEETEGNGHVKSSITNEQDRGITLAKSLSKNNIPLSLSELREVSASNILMKYHEIFPNYYHSPAVDDQLIKTATWNDIHQKDLSHMKVIIGTNADEYYANTPEKSDQEMVRNITSMLFKGESEIAFNALKNESDPRNSIDRLYTADGMLCPSEVLAERITSDNGNSWVYYFNRIREGEAAQHPMIRAYHGAELPYVFNTHDKWMTTNEVDLKITNIITDYWINFAKTGDPNGKNVPNWPMFDDDNNLVQSFGNSVQTIPSTEPILCKLYSARDKS